MFSTSTPTAKLRELLREVAEIDPRFVATALVEALSQGLPGPRDDELLFDIADRADARILEKRLTRLMGDARAETSARATALDVLVRGDARRYVEFVGVVEDELIAAAERAWIRMRLLDAEEGIRFGRDPIRDLLVASGPARLREVFERVEAERRRLGTSPGLIYDRCLGLPGTAHIEPLVLAALADAPDSFALSAVRAARARDSAGRAAHWRSIEDALAEDAGTHPRPRAEAWATACNGHGGFRVEVIVRRPDARSVGIGHLGFMLTMGVDHTIATGAIDCMVDDEALAQRRARAEAEAAEGEWAEASIVEIAALVRAGQPADHTCGTVRAIGRLVEWLSRPGDTPSPPPAPGAAATVSGLLERLRRPPFEMWLLDGDDFEQMDCFGPEDYEPAVWLPHARGAFIASGRHLLWADRARYMAWWFERAGDPDAAGLWASAARGMHVDPKGAPLTWALLEHSVIFALGGPGDMLDEHRWRHDPEGYLEAVYRLAAEQATPVDVAYDPAQPPSRDAWLALDSGRRVIAVMRGYLGEEAVEREEAVESDEEGDEDEDEERRWLAFRARTQAWVETCLAESGQAVMKNVFAQVRRGLPRAEAIRLIATAVACARAEAEGRVDSPDAAFEAIVPSILKLGEAERAKARGRRSGRGGRARP